MVYALLSCFSTTVSITFIQSRDFKSTSPTVKIIIDNPGNNEDNTGFESIQDIPYALGQKPKKVFPPRQQVSINVCKVSIHLSNS